MNQLGQNNSHKIGEEGENLAKKYLNDNGYKILETNWRFRKYEIDIIAQINDTIVFVEVKARKDNTFGEPEIFVDKKKQNFMIASAQHYMQENKLDLEARFDIIAIVNNNTTVKHLEEAFYPSIK